MSVGFGEKYGRDRVTSAYTCRVRSHISPDAVRRYGFPSYRWVCSVVAISVSRWVRDDGGANWDLIKRPLLSFLAVASAFAASLYILSR